MQSGEEEGRASRGGSKGEEKAIRGKVFIELSVYSPTSPHYGHGQDPISSSRKGGESERGSRERRIAKRWKRNEERGRRRREARCPTCRVETKRRVEEER